MFLPNDLTETEKTLVATIARQLEADRAPQNDSERRSLRLQAQEIAAEMIWESRGASGSVTEEQFETEEARLEAEEFDRQAQETLRREWEAIQAVEAEIAEQEQQELEAMYAERIRDQQD